MERQLLKRSCDILFSSIGLCILSPWLIVIAATIKLSSPGPVLYRGQRVGLRGMTFRIFKFRTMATDAEVMGGPSTSDNDPRITNIGKFLRKFKLDELPQFLNVLIGDMSFVGPRPQVPDYVARYNDVERGVLQVSPGITDWASIWNSDEGAVLANHSDPDKAYDELIHPTKMQLQLKYAREQSLAGDLKILVSTLFCLVWRNWVPAEICEIPKLGESTTQPMQCFATVTETPGTPINQEQLAMLHTRYAWAGSFVEGKDVLEVACGSGIGLGHLAARARTVVGGDCDAQLTEIGRGTYADRIAISTMDAHALPFEHNSFDVVLLFEAIYYLEHPERFLAEAYRVLRTDGIVLICSANCERPRFDESSFSKRYFSAGELLALLQQSDFRTEIYAGFPLAPGGLTDRIRDSVRAVAVKLRLMPKTMRWKARIKRLFFGKLQAIPTELGADLPKAVTLSRVNADQPVQQFKVLYAVGRRESMQRRSAA